MAKQPNLLSERIQARLAALGISPAEATKKAALSKDFIYDIFNGKKSNPRSNNLDSLARALECDPDYLTGRSDIPQSNLSHDYAPFDLGKFVDVRGSIAAGIWTDEGIDRSVIWSYKKSQFPIDKRYSPTSQFDLTVEGTSANLIALPGQNVRALEKFAWPSALRGGDLVVVETLEGRFREITLRRLKKFQGDDYTDTGFNLEFASSDQKWLTLHVPRVDRYGDPVDLSESNTTVKAIVLYVYGIGSTGEE